MKYNEFNAAKKYMKPTNSDHISVALKKKLIRRMEFTKFKRQYMTGTRLQSSKTVGSRNTPTINDVKVFESHSMKTIEVDLNKSPMLKSPSNMFNAARTMKKPIEEYGEAKYEELKSDPNLKNYFAEMFHNPNQIVKRDKKKIQSSANNEKTENNKAQTYKFGTANKSTVKNSASIFVNKYKCMDENLPESKRTKKRTGTFFIR
jgi:hypothetical protein